MTRVLVMFLLLAGILPSSSAPAGSHSPPTSSLTPSDASALLAFKLKADLQGKLGFSSNSSFNFCKWNGVRCSGDRAVRLVCQGMGLDGSFAPATLTRLDQLRVLSLQHNSLTGPIPDLSGLVNLKVLFLDYNFFTGLIPPSISTLHRLKTLDLSHNNITGDIPATFAGLGRLYYLRLDSNRLNGSIPLLNQSTLQIFNVSQNALSGPIPVTPTLSRFRTTAFAANRGLCGEIIHRECRPIQPFFRASPAASAPPPQPAKTLNQNAQLHRGGPYNPGKKSKRSVLIIGVSIGFFVLVCSIICFAMAARKSKNSTSSTPKIALDPSVTANSEAVTRIEEESHELEEKVKRVQEGMQVMGKSGNLIFSVGESQAYTLEQLLRASAELLGRGTMGSTYKAVLDNRLIVCVKRLDSGRMSGTSKDEFERHMESVAGLRHPNLVPLRAYFQAKEERLLVYDYHPNGSLFSLIHGSKSSRAKPLHWTSCLKIAEDVAQGLSYIHQAWRLVHGNLKSSNVLLGSDFEACISDYCLSVLANPFSEEDPNSAAHKAPETRKLNRHHQATSKSDVYSYGVMLLELLTGKHPWEHPVLMGGDVMNWVRSTREEEDGGEENESKLEMIVEVAMVCRVASPEQRPTMWQVLKMIQEIKDAVAAMEDDETDLLTGN